MRYPYTDQQLIRQRDYWRGKASERRHDVNRLERTLNEARLAKIDAQKEARQNFERANLAEIRANQAEEKLNDPRWRDHEIARLVQLLDDSEEREEDLKRQVSGIRDQLTARNHDVKVGRERIADLEERLERSKQVGDNLSEMLRDATRRAARAEYNLTRERGAYATHNVEQGRQIETLSASVGDSDRERVSNHATDVSDISEAITRYIDQAIEEHVVEEHVDD